jgi:hypothetical protein
VGNAPAALQRCMQPTGLRGQRGYGVSGGCGAAGLQFVSSNANNSYTLSQDLLQVQDCGIASTAPQSSLPSHSWHVLLNRG